MARRFAWMALFAWLPDKWIGGKAVLLHWTEDERGSVPRLAGRRVNVIMADEVLYEVKERIAVITLNLPEARNAVNGAVATAMHDIMHRFESDPEVWAAILTGAGNRAFSAGAD